MKEFRCTFETAKLDVYIMCELVNNCVACVRTSLKSAHLGNSGWANSLRTICGVRIVFDSHLPHQLIKLFIYEERTNYGRERQGRITPT